MTSLPWPSMLLVAGAFLAMFAGGEAIYRRWRVAPELTRKLDHAAAGGIALILPVVFDSPWPVFALAVPFLVFLVVTRLTGWLGSVHGIARASAGAFLYPVAISATFAIAGNEAGRYAIAILALALADAVSGLVGGRWGRWTYAVWGQAKTWEGSLAAFAVTTILASAILVASGTSPAGACLTGIFIGLVVALVEGALPWGLDNLGVPLAALAAFGAAGNAVSAGIVLMGAAALFGLALAVRRPAGARIRGRPAPQTAASDTG